MRIVFWQNCLSPHQLPYIVHLLDDERVDSVVIVANEAISKGRKDMGWNMTNYPNLEKCEIYLNPMPQMIEYLFSIRSEDTWHLFSGIRGFKFVFDALKVSLKYKLNRGLVVELPNTFYRGISNAKPLWMHRFRFYLQDRKYASYISKVFAMGNNAVRYYHSLSNQWQVFPFAYCTNECHLNMCNINGNAKFVFIGSLSPWKSPKSIVYAVHENINNNSFGQVTFVGDGSERQDIEKYCQANHIENVEILGTRNNSEIPSILQQQDILILPSLYDGWGAVVNEALSSGCYVICSDRCGAKELLSDSRCGRVFEGGNYRQLAAIMGECSDNIEMIRQNRDYRLRWAKQSISGSVIARYMIDCLTGDTVKRPWI